MEPNAALWGIMGPQEAILSFVKFYGAVWIPWSLMKPHEALWCNMEPYEVRWSPMETYEALWSPMEPYGAVWSIKKPYGAL